MAYSQANLHKVSDHANSTLVDTWLYQEDATVAAMAASGYFNSATKKLKRYDLIVLGGNNGTGLAQVTSATGAATVTVGALAALS